MPSTRNPPTGLTAFATACLILLLFAPTGKAQVPPAAPAATPTQPVSDPGFLTGLWTRSTLLGDAGGFRTKLQNVGLSLRHSGHQRGVGQRHRWHQAGAAYDGVTLMSVGLDTQQAFGWEGGTFNVSAWNIRGRSLSADNLLDCRR